MATPSGKKIQSKWKNKIKNIHMKSEKKEVKKKIVGIKPLKYTQPIVIIY